MTSYNVQTEQEKRFKAQLKQVQKELDAKITELVYKLSYDEKSSSLLSTQLTLKEIAKTRTEINKVLKEVKYIDLVNDTVNANSELVKASIAELPKSLRQNFGGFSKTTFNAINSLQKLEFASVGQDGMSEILKVLNGQVLAGASRSQALKVLRKKLNTDIVRHSETYIETSKNAFNQEVKNKIANDIGFSGIWKYVGASLMNNSHKECIWALSKKPKAPYFTTAEKIAFEKGLIPANRGGAIRYNCLHNFIMTTMTKEEYEAL